MVKQILRKSLNLDRWLLRQGRDYGFYLGPWHPAEAQRHHPATVGLGAAGGCLELMVDYHGLPWITEGNERFPWLFSPILLEDRHLNLLFPGDFWWDWIRSSA